MNTKKRTVGSGLVRSQFGIPFPPKALAFWHNDFRRRLNYPGRGTALARQVLEEFMAAFLEPQELVEIELGDHVISTGAFIKKAAQMLQDRERRTEMQRENEREGQVAGRISRKPRG